MGRRRFTFSFLFRRFPIYYYIGQESATRGAIRAVLWFFFCSCFKKPNSLFFFYWLKSFCSLIHNDDGCHCADIYGIYTVRRLCTVVQFMGVYNALKSACFPFFTSIRETKCYCRWGEKSERRETVRLSALGGGAAAVTCRRDDDSKSNTRKAPLRIFKVVVCYSSPLLLLYNNSPPVSHYDRYMESFSSEKNNNKLLLPVYCYLTPAKKVVTIVPWRQCDTHHDFLNVTLYKIFYHDSINNKVCIAFYTASS